MDAALLLLRRELRDHQGAMWVPLLALVLGIFLIGTIASLNAATRAGLALQGRAILGGDFEVRQIYRPVSAEQIAFFHALGRTSGIIEMRAMVHRGPAALLSELKAVDEAYPLAGTVTLSPSMTLAEALARRDGVPGAVADALLFERLHARPGDEIQVGAQRFVLRARLVDEPDRAARIFALGPRLMIGASEMAATGLAQPGALAYYSYRIVTASGGDFRAMVQRAYPGEAWRIRDVSDASEGTRRFLRDFDAFLVVIGIASLMLGGMGLFIGMLRYLEKRAYTIALLRCLGGRQGQIARCYGLLLVLLWVVALACGMLLAIPVPFLLAPWAEQYHVPFAAGFYGFPWVLTATTSLAVILGAGTIPLFRALRTEPAQLLRSRHIQLGHARFGDYLPFVPLLAALAGAAHFLGASPRLVLGILLLALGSAPLFLGLAASIRGLAARFLKKPVLLRQALLRRGTTRIIAILGLSLSLFVGLTQIGGNLRTIIAASLPARAPSFYFLDIPADMAARFDRAVTGFTGASDLQRLPMLRGRITRLQDIPVERIVRPAGEGWVLEGDRGITWSRTLPPGAPLTAGRWWAPDYQGPMLVSLDQDVAKAFNLKIGDRITVAVLGRSFDAEIANLRQIQWSGLAMNFVMVFSPGPLSAAPQTDIATVRVPPAREAKFLEAITSQFPNVSVVHVREVLDQVSQMLGALRNIILILSGVAFLAGLLVLSGAVAAEQADRRYEAILFKIMGASERRLVRLYAAEFLFLGLLAGLLALGVGLTAAFLFTHTLLGEPWRIQWDSAFLAVILGLAASLLAGFAGRWRALGQKVAPYLRNE
ncbi:MAG TPA: FtsX-like permease family protein [Dongiaceae bacterium]|jgi:putative ABC transport system permease protein|nr:FtsX-like permease family protein [Dongiaceae bacterium]